MTVMEEVSNDNDLTLLKGMAAEMPVNMRNKCSSMGQVE